MGIDDNKIVIYMPKEGIEKNNRLKPDRGNSYVRNFRGGDGSGVRLR